MARFASSASADGMASSSSEASSDETLPTDTAQGQEQQPPEPIDTPF